MFLAELSRVLLASQAHPVHNHGWEIGDTWAPASPSSAVDSAVALDKSIERMCLGSQFCRFQPMVSWPVVLGPVVRPGA